MNRLGAVPLALLWALPLLLSLALLVPTAVDGAAWTLALAHPQAFEFARRKHVCKFCIAHRREPHP